MTNMYKRVLLWGTIFISALAGAAGGAVTSLGSAAPAAHAASHCTRYGPSVNTTNCILYGTLANPGRYETPSFAWRDSNTITMNGDRWWELWYYDTLGGTYNYAAALGTGGSVGAVSASQVKPVCRLTNGTSVAGECDTWWHD